MLENNNNEIGFNNRNKILKKVKSDPSLMKNKIKLSQKEIEELTNKLHYDGELLKIKKQAKIAEELTNNSIYNNFSKENLNRSSIFILIKKILYEYSTSVKKNTFIDYTKNPKLNYEQYTDIMKDLYYLDKDALPEDYLEENTMYKELWNKLKRFSIGPENSVESNVLLLYLLELNGFFSNDKIIKELENEIYWINLQDYDDLIANSKYIEDNWGDLKMAKINNIRKLKKEGKYNPLHSEEFFNNNPNNTSINYNTINNNTTHFITTMKGNTYYYMIHGYKLKNNNDNSENSFLMLPNSSNNKEEKKHNSLSKSNPNNKKYKNRIPLTESYNDIWEKKKIELENKKIDDEEKFKEACTFKPQINSSFNNKLFSNRVRIELPKYKKSNSNILNNNSNNNDIINNKENNNNTINIEQNTSTIPNQSEININEKNIIKTNNHNFLTIKDIKSKKSQSKSPLLKNKKKKIINKSAMKRNKSSLQKIFTDNPLKNDKDFNDRIQNIKINRNNKNEKDNNYNNYVSPMRFDIEYKNSHDSIGAYINRNSNMKSRTQNVIFYNIKVNEKIKTLKYIEGDDLKLDVINFVRKNNLPEEVTDIILKKKKEKTLEETL